MSDVGDTRVSAPQGGMTGQHVPFSVLMCFYARSDAEALRLAFDSVTAEQTRPPAEVVLVQDGPIGADLRAGLGAMLASTTVPVKLVELPRNRGLGPALGAGLMHCGHDVVARMDADDIAMPHRFATQLPFIEAGADIVGAGLWEFGAEADDIVGLRVPVTEPERIAADMRFHQTFNHPTVVYRASAVRAAGGYDDFPHLEDYLLFARMIMNGVAVANVAEPLVKYRVGEGAYDRRGGLAMLRSEVALQQKFLDMGFTTRQQWFRNVAIRGVYRLLPASVKKVLFGAILARKGTPAEDPK